MKLTIELFDKVNESYYELEKNKLQGWYQFLKTENINILKNSINEYLTESISLVKEIGGNFADLDLMSINTKSILRSKSFNEELVFNSLESITMFVNNEIEGFNIRMSSVYSDDIVLESYMEIANNYRNEKLNYLYEESLFMLSSLEEMCILTENDNKPAVRKDENVSKDNTTEENKNSEEKTINKEKLVKKSKSIVSNVWEKIKEIIRKIRNMFKNKISQIRKRDGGWLKNNKGMINSVNLDGIVIDVYSDVNKSFDSIASELITISNKISSVRIDNPNSYEEFSKFTEKFRDKNGDLKQGVINYFRSSNSKTEPKIISLKGSQAKNALNNMYTYCETYLSKYMSMEKMLQKTEEIIIKFEQEAKRRGIGVTESYCMIEEDYYVNTDLMLCENYNILLEADKPGVTDNNNPNTVAKNMSDDRLSNLVKIARDDQMIASTILTVLETRYFEYIKIIKSLVK